MPRRDARGLARLGPTDVDVVIPYERGDLVSRVHADGRVQQTEHIADGTRIKARVPVALAASLRQFSAT
jgi:GTPase